jgi:hypothetical protein
MTNLNETLAALVAEHGIENVMSSIKNNNTNKVFIVNWYFQEHLEEFGFSFDENFSMDDFDEFMGKETRIYDLANQLVQEDFPDMWQEYKEINK